MREILYKYPIIYNANNELALIKDIYFPIYDQYDDTFTRTYYKLVKELYVNVPRYEESIKWSKFLWYKGLEKNRIDINLLIDKYNQISHDNEFNNCFIKFIWDYYKEKTFEKKILINQKNNYVIYNEKFFGQSMNVSEDIINCVEELGNNWRENHLNNNIISIELPIKHDINFAINIIKSYIDNDKEKSYILTRYVVKNNKKRETIYFLSKLLFKNKIGEKYLVENFKDEIFKDSDKYIIDKIILTAEKWGKFSEIQISIENYNILLNFLYECNNKLFDDKKLLPSINGEFNFLKDLYMEYNINKQIKNVAEEYANLKFNDKILNHKIQINNLNIKKYCMDDLLNEINQFFQSKSSINEKIEISKILINFVPNLESNDANDKIIEMHKDIRDIYFYKYKQLLKEEILETNVNTIWASVDKYIMIYTQNEFQNLKEIDIEKGNSYIELLNKYQKYFDFEKYELIPNSYGNFKKISELVDYNNIPEEIINGIKKIFFIDLKAKSCCKGININGIENRTLFDIGEIIQKCFYKKDEFNTYEFSKIIIKYIPKEGDIKTYQIRLYNLYKQFDKTIGDIFEIDSYDNLYKDINKDIITYINKKINDCHKVNRTKEFIDDIFTFINDNKDILDPDKYNILPNQLGTLKTLNKLAKDNGIFEELKEIISDYWDVKELLLDKRITKFKPEKVINNEDIKIKINQLIEKKNFDIKRILKLIPKNDIEGKKKQKDIKFLYEKFFYKDKELEEHEIDLEPSFWEKANKCALNKIINCFENDNSKSIKKKKKKP